MGFNIQEMLQKAQQVQSEIERMKTEAANIIVVGSAGGEMVSVKINGNNHVLAVNISKELIEEKDVEMLQDLLAAAFNNAVREAQDKMKGELSKLSGMLPNIPGLNLGL